MSSTLKRTLACLALFALTGCGTMSGIGHGIGEVLTGAGDDFTSLGDVFDR